MKPFDAFLERPDVKECLSKTPSDADNLRNLTPLQQLTIVLTFDIVKMSIQSFEMQKAARAFNEELRKHYPEIKK
ncbi:MAG: hypothetical protein JWO44_2771 [Bacteroidetes bacterium]|nr:hypothetical protein [Bacteroidota bacterium]